MVRHGSFRIRRKATQRGHRDTIGITDNDAFSCNYTSQNASAWQTHPPFSNASWASYLNLTHAPRTDYFDIEFPYGLTYADIVECNFSMTVDPDKVRLPGSGQTDGQVIFSPVMERRVIDLFPANDGNLHAMGQPVSLEVKMETLDCEDPLVWDTVTDLCSYANTLERCQVRHERTHISLHSSSAYSAPDPLACKSINIRETLI